MTRKISDKKIREVAERLSILDVVSPVVSLQKSGKSYKGLCPFHPDKNPSLVVNPDRNTFYCFGCGAGGDIYSFFMRIHRLSFPQALEELARRAGLPLERTGDGQLSQADRMRQAGLALNALASRFFHDTLSRSKEAERARQYLRQRGIDSSIVSLYALGYAPNRWNALAGYLEKKGASVELACQLGLLARRKSGGGFFDRFRNRIIFPITDAEGRTVAFGGRSLGDELPKYLNSQDSFLYRKGSFLYGLSEARQSIREQDVVILVEGYFDLLTMHQNGFTHAVAVLGTSLTEAQIGSLRLLTRNFVLVFDGDLAGKKASFRNIGEFLEKGISAKAVYLPPGEDPDSYLRAQGREAFLSLLEHARPLMDLFLEDRLHGIRADAGVDTRLKLLREILPLFRRIPDPLERNLRIQQLADRVGVPEPFLREELSKPRDDKIGQPACSGREDLDGGADWSPEERLICKVLAQFPILAQRFLESGSLDKVRSPSARDLILACAESAGEGDACAPTGRIRQDEDLARFVARASCVGEFTLPEAEVALADAIRRIQKRDLLERLSDLNKRIREAEVSNQPELQARLFREKQRIIQQEKALLS